MEIPRFGHKEKMTIATGLAVVLFICNFLGPEYSTAGLQVINACFDDNRNGVCDDTDTPLSGIAIGLTPPKGSIYDTTIMTDSRGVILVDTGVDWEFDSSDNSDFALESFSKVAGKYNFMFARPANPDQQTG